MKTYILCNRKVVIENNVERFANKGKENAQHDFRVAQYKGGSEYEILPDNEDVDYELLVDKLEGQESIELKGTAKMFYDLYKTMRNNENCDTLVFIHGFANSFDDNLKHIAKIEQLFMGTGSPIKNLVFVSWPSRNHKVLTYWDDQKDARETGRVMARAYDKLYGFFKTMFDIYKKEQCGNKIHLAAHSMGNQVLECMLDGLPRHTGSFLGEVLLLHSDADHDLFEPGESFSKLEKISDRTHVYIHNSDDALFISTATKNRLKKRLGKRGPKNLDSLNKETFIIDTTNLYKPDTKREKRIDHWGYLERPEVTKDIIEVLKGAPEKKIENRVPKGENYFYRQYPAKRVSKKYPRVWLFLKLNPFFKYN